MTTSALDFIHESPIREAAQKAFESIHLLDEKSRQLRLSLLEDGVRSRVEYLIRLSTCSECGRIKPHYNATCLHGEVPNYDCFDFVGRVTPSGFGWTKQDGLFN